CIVRNRNRLARRKTVELILRIAAEPTRKGSAWDRAHLREIALPLQRRRHGCGIRFTLAVAESLVISEEEGFVFNDRPAEGAAELILLQRLNRLSEVIRRVEGVVAQKLPGSAVK